MTYAFNLNRTKGPFFSLLIIKSSINNGIFISFSKKLKLIYFKEFTIIEFF